MAFVPEMSTDSICVGADTTLCLSDKLKDMDAAIQAGQGGGAAVEPMAIADMHLGKLDNNNGAELASSVRICSEPIAIQVGKTYWQVNTKGVNMYVLLYDANEMFVQFEGNIPSGQAISIDHAEAAYLRLCSLVGEYDLTNEFRIYDMDPAGGGSGEVVDAYTKAEADERFAAVSHTHSEYAEITHHHAYDEITDKPATFAPTAHKNSHATGGADALSPADIGAAPAASLTDHVGDTGNPHRVTKDQVGLGNVDNTSDAAKPISAAVQSALDAKAAAGDLSAHTGNKSNPHSVTADQVGAVPVTRKVNNKVLSADLNLTAADVGARPSTWLPTPAEVGATFDRVIRTQAEFNTLIASTTWLGAKSVCFVGNGGSLKFTRSDGQGIKIPQTVKQIQGMNQAIIEVTGFVYHKTSNKAALYYDTLPSTDAYSIRDLTVSCTGTPKAPGFAYCKNLTNCTGAGNSPGTGDGNNFYGYGFYECHNLLCCIGTGTGTGTGNDFAYGEGFSECHHLTDCIGTGTGTGTGNSTGNIFGYGFYGCDSLMNCEASGSAITPDDSSGFSYGFYSCDNITNSTGQGTGSGSCYGFGACDNLTNCSSTGTGKYGNSSGGGFFSCEKLTNCEGVGTGVGTGEGMGFRSCRYLSNCKGSGMNRDSDNGYCFYNCSYLNSCNSVAPGYTTGFLGGSNTMVDTNTVKG